MSFDNPIEFCTQEEITSEERISIACEKLSGRISSSGSPALGNITLTTSDHVFKTRQYRYFVRCAHCDRLISSGLKKAGMHCKRCGIDIHEKCREDLIKRCVEVILGRHHFRHKTYTRVTYCDHCKKLLTGMTRQGLKCSECGTNVHSKCQELIEARCEGSKRRSSYEEPKRRSSKDLRAKQKSSSSSPIRQYIPSTSSVEAHVVTEKTPLLSHGSEESFVLDASKLFQTMPIPPTSQMATSQSVSSLPQSPQNEKKHIRTRSLDATLVFALEHQLEEVTGIMISNVQKMNEREENLNSLKDKTEQLEEQSKIFANKSKEIKKEATMGNRKLWIIIAAVITLIIIVLILLVVIETK